MRRALAAVALFAATPLLAHVGDLNSVFDGMAGPYPIRVVVRTPGVVPGRAQISVRTSAPDVEQIAVKPVRWDAREAGSPPPDIAQPVRGERGLYAAELWLMANGSHSIYVDVTGKRGSGRAIVPVTNMAVKRLPMPSFLGILLAVLGAILVLGAISIVGAAVREATGATSPGRARLGMVIAAVVCVLLVARGQAWWNSVDARYRQRMFKPLHVTTAVDAGQLTLTIDDKRWQLQARGWSALIPDHGKLMHLFLIAADGRGDVAHLHPVALSRERFRATVPPLAPGRYRLFADITHESGLAQTLLDTVTIGAATPAPPSDPDDSWFSPAHPSAGTLVFDAPKLVAGRDTDLRFEVRDAAGHPVAPEPYMGMAGHAIIVADDFSVFVHAHPNGTISMASQQKFLERDGMADHSMHDMHAGAAPTIDFPYAFPKPGRYHLWVQAKVNGEVVTRRFDVTVG
jgi:hypothetical protein